MGSNSLESWGRLLQKYWQYVQAHHMPLELEMMRLDAAAVRGMNADEFRRFLLDKYFPWKFTAANILAANSKTLQESAGSVDLGAIQTRLFSANHKDILSCLHAAMGIPGLGTAGASGLLALLFPESFATVDQFVVRALREVPALEDQEAIAAMKPELTPQDGVILIKIMREKACDLKKATGAPWTPRMVDMALWAYRP